MLYIPHSHLIQLRKVITHFVLRFLIKSVSIHFPDHFTGMSALMQIVSEEKKNPLLELAFFYYLGLFSTIIIVNWPDRLQLLCFFM